MRASLLMLSVLLLTVVGCGGDDGSGGQAGTTIGGVGGVPATGGVGGAAGTIAGTGTGGTIAGTGIAGMGTGGTGMPATTPDCAVFEAMAPGTPRGTREAVGVILRGDGSATNPMGSCAFSSCHSSTAKAMLDVSVMPDFATTLVNVPACETPDLMRVKPGDPLASWLWIKLVGPADAEGNITYPATPQNCSGAPPGTLGILMPWSPGSPTSLLPAQLFQICTWIQDGAL